MNNDLHLNALLNSVGEALTSYDIKSYTYNGSTAEECYEKMNLKGSEKPDKDEFLAKVESKINYYLLKQIRSERVLLLTECDWTQSRDLVLNNDEEWKKYRQALRDLPETVDVKNPVYPLKPLK